MSWNQIVAGLSVFALSALCSLGQTVTLIPAGAQWRYLDDGSDQGSAWRALEFDDGEWESGRAQLGYGDGDEATLLQFGPNPNDKYVTAYFRHQFFLADTNLSAVTNMLLRVLRDDGVIVYLNGQEIFRNSMFPGPVHFRTYASATTEGNTFLSTNMPPAFLVAGTNVIAAEIHQSTPDSSDISFNLDFIVQLAQGPPTILRQPRSLSAFLGQQASFSVAAVGRGPLSYQWYRDDAPISNATNTSFVIASASGADAGAYYVVITNGSGSSISVTATLNVVEPVDDTFQVVSIETNGALVVANTAILDDRAGIAASGTHLFVNGQNGAAQLGIDNLQGASLGIIYDALVSNLRTERVYTFANGTNPLVNGALFVADTLIELDGLTGRITTNVINLSTQINVGFSPGFFSGFNRAVVLNGERALNIALPSGEVTDLGAMASPPRNFSESGMFWGIAEYFDDTVFLVYVRDPVTIVRTSVPSLQTEPLATFSNLGDMASLTVSLSRQRWYFHYEGFSQFGFREQATGYADASFSYVSIPRPPAITSEPQSRFAAAGAPLSLSVSVLGTPPMIFQWYLNDEPIAHGTNATLTIDSATPEDSGFYFVVVDNVAGSASSTPVQITVVNVAREMFDDFEPGIDASQWSAFSGDVRAINYGGSVSGPNSLWFGGDDIRYAVSRPLDTSNGGLISFNLRLADGPAYPWESAQDFNQGIIFQSSVDGGSNWFYLTEFPSPGYREWAPQFIFIPEFTRSEFTLFRWIQFNHGGDRFDHWALDDVSIRPIPLTPEIVIQPASQRVLRGGTTYFEVGAIGEEPLGFQWRYNGVDISGEESPFLTVTNVNAANTGAYSVVVSNAHGVVASSNAILEVFELTGEALQIIDLHADNSRVIDHNGLTGDDRGGIAASATRVFYSGDGSTARFNLGDLSGGARLNTIYDGLVSNLRTGTVYVLARGTNLVNPGSGESIDALLELDSNTGALLVNRRIPLSRPIPGGNFGMGIFSGYDRIVLHTGSQAYHIQLPDGTVDDLGNVFGIGANGCENGWFYGIAEFFDGNLNLAYVSGADIMRMRLPDGTPEIISRFNNLSDMCGFTLSLALDRWYFHYEGGAQFGGSSETIGYADASIRSPLPPKPVQILVQPANQASIEGMAATFSVSARGGWPVSYQWRFDGVDIPGGTNTIYHIANVTAAAVGGYSVVVSNTLGAVTSIVATLRVDPLTADSFVVRSLSATGSRIVGHAAVTGDDRGGIAISSNQVFYSGDEATARFGIDDLAGGTRVGRIYDALVSNVRTEQVYSLGNGATPLGGNGGTVNSLIEINGNSGALTGTRINLSQSFTLPSSGVGIFAGWGRIAIHTGSRVYQVLLPSGQVQDMGAMASPPHSGCENWAYWGVAEFFGGSLHLLYVRDFNTIARSRVPDGLVTEVSRLNGLGDMCSMTVSPYRNRWYFHYEFGGVFGGFDETVGFADADLLFAPIAPRITMQPRSRSTIEGASATFNVLASGGAATLSYQWRKNDLDLQGQTNSSLQLDAAQNSDAGDYTVVISNVLGSVTSQIATLTVRPVQGKSFRITNLSASGTNIAYAGAITSSRRSSIALSSGRVFQTGFGSTGRWRADDLSSGEPLSQIYDDLVSDLHFERLYGLALQEDRFTLGVPAIDRLIHLDAETALPTGTVILLSQQIPMSFDVGLYSGFERVVIYNGTNVFDIDLPSGHVTDFGPVVLPPRNTCSLPMNWGVAEYFNGAIHLAYVRDNRTIVRTRIPDGVTSTVATHNELGDMCAFTFSPSLNRWYFAFNFSQFGFDTAVGYASAAWDQPNTLPIISLTQTNIEIVEDGIAENVAVNFFDAETAPENFLIAVESSNPALVPASQVIITDAGTNRLLSITPLADSSGAATVTLSLTDAHGVRVSRDVQVVVRPINDPPVFANGADMTLAEDSGPVAQVNWASAVSPGPADEADQQLTFMTATDNAGLFSVLPAISPTGLLSFQPAPNANGVANVMVTLRDNGGTADGGQDTSAVQTFRIAVLPINDPPTFTSGVNISVAEDALTQTLAAWATALSVGPANEAGQTLSFTTTTDTPALFEIQPSLSPNGALTFKPAANANGTANISVVLRDNGGVENGGSDTSAPQAFQIAILPVNDPPSFTRGPDFTVMEDAGPQLAVAWATTISGGPANEAGQTLAFAVSADNPSLFDALPALTSSGALSFTPRANANGSANVTVRLQDNGGTANGGQDTSPPQTFRITVQGVNDPPVANDQFVTVAEDQSSAVTLGASDADGDTLSYSVGSPSHGTLAGSAPSLTYTPAANYFGADSFTYTVGDGQASVTATVSINVTPVNDLPNAIIHVSSPDRIETNGSTYILLSADNLSAIGVLDASASSDVDGDVLTYSWFELGAAQPFDAGVRVTNEFAVGTHSLVLLVSDGEDFASASVVLEVISVSEILEGMILLIDTADTGRRNIRPLLASLKAAIAAFDTERTTPALNQLRAFQNKVRAQLRPVDPALADALTDAAQDIIDLFER